MVRQHGRRLFGICKIEALVNVIDAEAKLLAQHHRGADVGGDHRFFHNAVGDAARLGDNIQHFAFFTQQEAVVGAIFKHQRMLLAPLDARLAETMQ